MESSEIYFATVFTKNNTNGLINLNTKNCYKLYKENANLEWLTLAKLSHASGKVA